MKNYPKLNFKKPKVASHGFRKRFWFQFQKEVSVSVSGIPKLLLPELLWLRVSQEAAVLLLSANATVT